MTENTMKVCKNAASNNNKPPLSLEDAQKIVNSLDRIWEKMITYIREDESTLNNQGRNDPDAGTSSCNNHEKKEKEMNSEENPNGITDKNASNVCNTSKITTGDSRDSTKSKEINVTLKDKIYRNRKGKVGAKKSRKSTSSNTDEVHVNTVKLLAENEQVTKVVTTSSNADGEKRECLQSLKRKGSTDNVTSKKRRLAEVDSQILVTNCVSNKENGHPDENGEKVDLSDESQQKTIKSDNQNKTEEVNKSTDIIEISDNKDNPKKPTKKGTTVNVCDAKNKKTDGDINSDTLDKLRILNDTTIESFRAILKNASISTNPSISSLAPSTSPLSASKPVQPGTSNCSQEPNVSLSHVTTPLNLPIPENTEILVTSMPSVQRSSAPSKSLAHTSKSKPSPQGSTLSSEQPPTNLLTPGLLPSATRSTTPVFSSPSPTPITDKPSGPTVNQRKYLRAMPKLTPIRSQLSSSTLAGCDSPVAMQPVPSSTAFTAQMPFAAPSHFTAPLNLPFRSELSVTCISSLQKSPNQSHIPSFIRGHTRSNSPAEGAMHPHQPPKTWHIPVPSTSVQEGSPAASSFETYSYKQRSNELAYPVTLSNLERRVSMTPKSPFQNPSIPPQAVQAIPPGPAIRPTFFFDSVTALRDRSTPRTPPSALLKRQVTRPAIPSSVQRAPVPISGTSRSNFPVSSPTFNMPIRPPMPIIPNHPELVHRTRPNLLPGIPLDVCMRGMPSFYDPNFTTNQAIHNLVTEYYYKACL